MVQPWLRGDGASPLHVSNKTKMKQEIILTPAQRKAAEGLREECGTAGRAAVLVLRGSAGSGKTTVLEWLHSVCGGVILGAGQFIHSVDEGPPDAIEEAFLRIVE